MSEYPAPMDLVHAFQRKGVHAAVCQMIAQKMMLGDQTAAGDLPMMAMDVARIERGLVLENTQTGERHKHPPLPNPFEPSQDEHVEWERAIAHCRATLDTIEAARFFAAGDVEKETERCP